MQYMYTNDNINISKLGPPPGLAYQNDLPINALNYNYQSQIPFRFDESKSNDLKQPPGLDIDINSKPEINSIENKSDCKAIEDDIKNMADFKVALECFLYKEKNTDILLTTDDDFINFISLSTRKKIMKALYSFMENKDYHQIDSLNEELRVKDETLYLHVRKRLCDNSELLRRFPDNIIKFLKLTEFKKLNDSIDYLVSDMFNSEKNNTMQSIDTMHSIDITDSSDRILEMDKINENNYYGPIGKVCKSDFDSSLIETQKSNIVSDSNSSISNLSNDENESHSSFDSLLERKFNYTIRVTYRPHNNPSLTDLDDSEIINLLNINKIKILQIMNPIKRIKDRRTHKKKSSWYVKLSSESEINAAVKKLNNSFYKGNIINIIKDDQRQMNR